ncbi:hypothetical protein MF271_20530 (plasmid) [Deinococcus sp. KNUC1210]|nr:hypothetical protein [Deinococcus sp. KNUC1210]ULH17787.1 hypothetical protein MF271_20530 [Deinococcus sp. KNUC1210]
MNVGVPWLCGTLPSELDILNGSSGAPLGFLDLSENYPLHDRTGAHFGYA